MPEKSRRILVSAAGMIFELAIAAGAALVWLHVERGTLLSQLAYNLVFLASVTTILFNANPLLRFDGYYILSDLLEIPNLYERSTRHLRHWAMRHLFGLKHVPPVAHELFDKVAMSLYGVASQVYRAIIMIGIAFFVAQSIPTLGLIIGTWSIISWAVLPSIKFLHWLITSPSLHEHRLRASAVTAALALGMLIGVGYIPMPEHRRAQGVVESARTADVVVASDGFIRQVLVERGQRVTQGQVMLIAHNPQLEAQSAELQARLDRLHIERRVALAQDPNQLRTVEAQIQPLASELEQVRRRLAELTLTAPQDGVVVGPINANMVGAFATRGQIMARVQDLANLRVTAMVDQTTSDTAFFDQIGHVELRTIGDVERVLPSAVTYRSRKGRQSLPHPALGYHGGGHIAVDPKDEHGLTSLHPLFEMWLALPDHTADGQASPTLGNDAAPPRFIPGQRVYVRFTLKERRPLLFQWAHRLRQVLRDRLPDLPLL